jgi:hypothetical protein
MKKILSTLSIAVLLFTLITACQQSKEKTEPTEANQSMDSTSVDEPPKITYTCTMHPEVVKDEPGKCPKCGMDLVKKEVGETTMDSTKRD